MKLDFNTVHKVIQSNKDLKNYYKWYLSHCLSLNAPYHNLNHTLGMMYHIICIYENSKIRSDYGFVLSEKDLYILLTSALFHDYNHSAGLCPDSINVETAKAGLEQCIKSFLVNDENTEKLIEICKSNIDATQYPYVIDDSELNIYQQILRECDILVALYDDFFVHNIIGLGSEMHKADDLLEFMTSNMKFLQDAFCRIKLVYSLEIYNEESDNFFTTVRNILNVLK